MKPWLPTHRCVVLKTPTLFDPVFTTMRSNPPHRYWYLRLRFLMARYRLHKTVVPGNLLLLLLMYRLIELLSVLATTRSGYPSRLKSPTASAYGNKRWTHRLVQPWMCRLPRRVAVLKFPRIPAAHAESTSSRCYSICENHLTFSPRIKFYFGDQCCGTIIKYNWSAMPAGDTSHARKDAPETVLVF